MSFLGRWLGTDREADYRSAIDLYNARRYAEAVAAFGGFLAGHVVPSDPRGSLARFYLAEAHSELGWAALEAGERERARDEFLAALDAGYRYPDLHLRLGRLHEELGEEAPAERAYGAALEIHSGLQEARARRARLRLIGGRPPEEDLARLAEVGWSLPLGWERLDGGDGHDLAALRVAIIDALGAALVERERVADEIGAALDAFESEAGETALARLEAALRLRPDYPDLHFRIGVLHARAGRRDPAAEAFARAVELNPGYAEAQSWLRRVRDSRAA